VGNGGRVEALLWVRGFLQSLAGFARLHVCVRVCVDGLYGAVLENSKYIHDSRLLSLLSLIFSSPCFPLSLLLFLDVLTLRFRANELESLGRASMSSVSEVSEIDMKGGQGLDV